MAREKNYDKAIEAIDGKIAKAEDELASLKAQKAELLEQKKQQDLEKLLVAIDSKGISVEEACSLILG